MDTALSSLMSIIKLFDNLSLNLPQIIFNTVKRNGLKEWIKGRFMRWFLFKLRPYLIKTGDSRHPDILHFLL
jgi:hypothetical protein